MKEEMFKNFAFLADLLPDNMKPKKVPGPKNLTDTEELSPETEKAFTHIIRGLETMYKQNTHSFALVCAYISYFNDKFE